jgi:hypothetical protein
MCYAVKREGLREKGKPLDYLLLQIEIDEKRNSKNSS